MPPPLTPQQVADMLHGLDERMQTIEANVANSSEETRESLAIWRRCLMGNIVSLDKKVDDGDGVILAEIRAIREMIWQLSSQEGEEVRPELEILKSMIQEG